MAREDPGVPKRERRGLREKESWHEGECPPQSERAQQARYRCGLRSHLVPNLGEENKKGACFPGNMGASGLSSVKWGGGGESGEKPSDRLAKVWSGIKGWVN